MLSPPEAETTALAWPERRISVVSAPEATGEGQWPGDYGDDSPDDEGRVVWKGEVAVRGGQGERATTVFPLGAVLTGRDGRRHVLRVDAEGRVSEVAVELVALTDAGALVAGSTNPGDRVVAAGGEFIAVGSRVRPVAVKR